MTPQGVPRHNDYYRGRSPRNASQTLLERLLATGFICEEMVQMDKGKVRADLDENGRFRNESQRLGSGTSDLLPAVH